MSTEEIVYSVPSDQDWFDVQKWVAEDVILVNSAAVMTSSVYWQYGWNDDPLVWLHGENSEWPGN